MNAVFFKTLWGHNGSPREAASQASEDGFIGLEGPLPPEPTAFLDALAEFNLQFIAEISTTGFAVPDPGTTVDDHIQAFERILDHSLAAYPRLVTTMAGCDLWAFRESVDFLARAHAIAQDRGVRCGFETHRSRSLYHPIRTAEMLAELPGDLELTIDFSHWCVVTERLVLDELPEILSLCASRALHIHPRVGYDQGAQVPDPRAPEYAPAVDAHIRWWRSLWDGQRRRGFADTTMTPEFGPDGYLQCEPFTRRPVADLRDLNLWTANRLRAEFADWHTLQS